MKWQAHCKFSFIWKNTYNPFSHKALCKVNLKVIDKPILSQHSVSILLPTTKRRSTNLFSLKISTNLLLFKRTTNLLLLKRSTNLLLLKRAANLLLLKRSTSLIPHKSTLSIYFYLNDLQAFSTHRHPGNLLLLKRSASLFHTKAPCQFTFHFKDHLQAYCA